jgi:sigma-E factor negative regulatory protein RseB
MSSMPRAVLLSKLAVALIGFAALTAYADDVAPDKRDAQAWLKTIKEAAQKQSYTGTFVFQQANQVRTSRVTHMLDGKNELEKLEILDGRPREYIRKNEEVACYIPEIRTIMVEKRSTPDFFPAMLAANAPDLSEHYDIKKGDIARIAGYDCQTILMEPKDKLRYGYRLFAEKNTGLLLAAQTVNDKGQVIEQISFAQIMIGQIDKNSVRPSFPNTSGWHIESSNAEQTAVSGWSVKAVPTGFKKIHELKRMVADAEPAAAGGVPGQHPLTQLVFSDGLAAISVFIEPGTQSRTESTLQQGATNIVGKRQDGFWLTIVGEVPSAAVMQVANSIEFKK